MTRSTRCHPIAKRRFLFYRVIYSASFVTCRFNLISLFKKWQNKIKGKRPGRLQLSVSQVTRSLAIERIVHGNSSRESEREKRPCCSNIQIKFRKTDAQKTIEHADYKLQPLLLSRMIHWTFNVLD